MIDAALNNFGRILRHFAAPVVGLGVVHCIDPTSSVIPSLATVAHTGNPPEPVISWVPLTMFTLVFGVILYHGHRTLFHSWFNRLDVWAIGYFRTTHVSARQLDLARAHRENAPENAPERAYQMRLNDYNAACHFLWCSAWSVWLVPLLLARKFPQISVATLWREYLCAFVVLFLIAVISDVWATVRDFYAYEVYPLFRGASV